MYTKKFIIILYERFINFFTDIGNFTILFIGIIKSLHRVFRDRKLILDQMVHVGVNSLLLVSIIGFFTGVVASWQASYQIGDLISKNFLGSATSKAIILELGPVLSAIVLAGRVGASMSAEIGTMKVTEQIDALESMAINPVRYLAMPRVVATTLMMPILVIYASAVAIFGSYLAAVVFLEVPPTSFMNGFRNNFLIKDVFAAVIKALFFGVSVSSIGCFYGFKTTEGAQGVGLSTIKAFVISAAVILILDSLLWNFLIGG